MRNRVQFFLEVLDTAGLLRIADACLRDLDDPVAAYRAVGRFVAALAAAADGADAREWSLLRRAVSLHPLIRELRRDPLVAHASQSGPAAPETTLGDLMLRHPEGDRLVRAADRVGRNIYPATSALPAAEAMRDRRRLIARLADAVAEERRGAEILAVDPGYMREAEASLAGPSGGIRRWVGLVSEAASASEIARSLPLPWVVPLPRNTLATLLRSDLIGTFDFVYCKSLEVMPDALAESLIVAAFARLHSGGRLLVSCRAPGASDAAFWTLLGGSAMHLRDEAALSRLAGALDSREVAARRGFGGVNEAIAYLEVVKA